MKKKSRTDNAIKNTKITMLCHIIYLICSFVCRTVFSKRLGEEYLGIGGLFSNILTILSFAELGLGSALVYRMYKPFAEEDYDKINLYVKLYKKIYSVIMLIILVLGIAIIPFLKYLVDAPNVKENLVVLYLLFLSQTITSYLFVYKKTLLTADQKNYIISLFNEFFNVIMNVLQCIFLLFFTNYILYLMISIICGISNNILCSFYVDRKYKFLNKNVKGSLTKGEIVNLKKDAKGLLTTKIAEAAFSGTDNIFISSFIGIKYVGILSNYTLILTTINSLMNKVFSSMTASIGNLVVSRDKIEKTENVLFKLFFLNTALYSYICIGLALLISEFVTKYWLNSSFYLSNTIVILAIIELYLRSIHFPLFIVRNAMGLFSQYRFVFVIAAVLNIILDFILVKPLGISGLIIATIICRCLTYIIDIFVVYKYGFQKNPKKYFFNILKWIVFAILCYLLSLFVIMQLKSNIIYFIVKIFIVTIIYLIMFILVYGKSDEAKYYVQLFKYKFFKRDV